MKKTIFSLTLIIFSSLFFLSSCENGTNKTKENALFPKENEPYELEFQLEEWNGEAKLNFIDNEMHLIHHDQNSPLYQLEEIYTKEKFYARYQNITYETSPKTCGCGIIFHLFNIIETKTPVATQKEKEVTHFTYKTEDFQFVLSKNPKESLPITITGLDNPSYFKIKIKKIT